MGEQENTEENEEEGGKDTGRERDPGEEKVKGMISCLLQGRKHERTAEPRLPTPELCVHPSPAPHALGGAGK